jgi:hypothetical protein
MNSYLEHIYISNVHSSCNIVAKPFRKHILKLISLYFFLRCIKDNEDRGFVSFWKAVEVFLLKALFRLPPGQTEQNHGRYHL